MLNKAKRAYGNMNIRSKNATAFIICCLLSSPIYSQDTGILSTESRVSNQPPSTLCSEEEKTIFRCLIGNKAASLCVNDKQNDPTVQYRYGTNEKLELVYPSTQTASSKKFKLSSTPYPGGGANRIRFTNRGYSYYMYEITITTLDSDNQPYPTFESGILIQKDGKNIGSLHCENEVNGISSMAFDIFDEEEFDRNINMSSTTSPDH